MGGRAGITVNIALPEIKEIKLIDFNKRIPGMIVSYALLVHIRMACGQ